jgi:hypothetical protein
LWRSAGFSRQILTIPVPLPHECGVPGGLDAALPCCRADGQIGGTNRVFAAALRSPNGALTWIIVNGPPQASAARLLISSLHPQALFRHRVASAQRDQPGLHIDQKMKGSDRPFQDPFTRTPQMNR